MQISRRPLRSFPNDHAFRLWACLWDIHPCTKGAGDHQTCMKQNCTDQLEARLGRHLRFYKGLTETYLVNPAQGQPALDTHDEVLRLICALKSMPDRPRQEVVRACFNIQAGNSGSSTSDQERALDIAVRVMIMMNSRTHGFSPGILESGGYQSGWVHGHSLAQFIESSFPGTNPQTWDQMQAADDDTISAITAQRLVKRARLSFEPTDDLRKHLELDRKSGTVSIFHHAAFLKEHLKLTKGLPMDMTVSDQLRRLVTNKSTTK